MRKSPVRHRVRDYRKKGKPIKSYLRGSGEQSKLAKPTVGRFLKANDEQMELLQYINDNEPVDLKGLYKILPLVGQKQKYLLEKAKSQGFKGPASTAAFQIAWTLKRKGFIDRDENWDWIITEKGKRFLEGENIPYKKRRLREELPTDKQIISIFRTQRQKTEEPLLIKYLTEDYSGNKNPETRDFVFEYLNSKVLPFDRFRDEWLVTHKPTNTKYYLQDDIARVNPIITSGPNKGSNSHSYDVRKLDNETEQELMERIHKEREESTERRIVNKATLPEALEGVENFKKSIRRYAEINKENEKIKKELRKERKEWEEKFDEGY